MSNTTNPLPYENIERLVTTEMRPSNMIQGYVLPLYKEARGDGPPLTLQIANDIAEASKGRVAIVTGIVFEHFPHGEMDGPVGAAVLARALTKLGRSVDLLVEDEIIPVVERLVQRLGVDVGIRSTSNRSSEEVKKWADDYVIAVTIEKLGRAKNGTRHSIMATPLPPGDSYIDDFILEMNKQKKVTVGLGDGGNEIGFGKIHDKVKEIVPKGDTMGTVTPTTHVFPAAVSNFGAYAICAALAVRTENTELLVDGDTVIALIRDAIAEGCLDGGTVDPNFVGDDGIPKEGVSGVVDVLHTIVTQWFGSFDRHF